MSSFTSTLIWRAVPPRYVPFITRPFFSVMVSANPLVAMLAVAKTIAAYCRRISVISGVFSSLIVRRTTPGFGLPRRARCVNNGGCLGHRRGLCGPAEFGDGGFHFFQLGRDA